MTPDIFAKYLDQPMLLVSMPYQELKTLVVQYPYAQNLRLMLLLKSILDNHKDKERNLQLAATYSTDRDALYSILQKIEDKAMTPVQAAHFLMEEDVLVLKSLAEVDHLLKKMPEPTAAFTEKIELQIEPFTQQHSVDEFEDINEIEQTDNQASLQENRNTVEFEIQEEELQEGYEAFGDEYPTNANAASDSLEAAVPTAPPQPKEIAMTTHEEEIPFEIYVADHKIPDTMEKIAVDLNVDDIFDEIALFNQKTLSDTPPTEPHRPIKAIVMEKVVTTAPAPIVQKVVILPIISISEPQKVILQPAVSKVVPVVATEKPTFYQEISQQSIEDNEHSSVNDFLTFLLESQEATYIMPAASLKNAVTFNDKGDSIEEEEQEEAFASETLAALLVKQGAKDKAIKMYQKLSLTFPEKSTYFAAQIADLRIIRN